MEDRKQKEVDHSNFRRSIVEGYEYLSDSAADSVLKGFVKDQERYDYYFSNMKFYSIIRSSEAYFKKEVLKRCRGNVVLDFCCGNGEAAVFMAQNGAAKTHGIDISDVAIENAKKLSREGKVSNNLFFEVMDAENLKFEDNYFDLIFEYGALHHLEFEKAIRELARVLKPDGSIICVEALGHNPFIQMYRRRTPHLRTVWEAEHILKMKQIEITKEYFSDIKIKFFHLTAILAVPLRKTRFFYFVLSISEAIDSLLTKLPFIKLWAWQTIFILSSPKKA